MYSNRDATDYVIACIEANGTADRAEYDVAAIVSHLRDVIGSYDFAGELPGHMDEFWNAVNYYAL